TVWARYGTYAAAPSGPSWLSTLYRIVVLPVPTSPMSVMKPRPFRSPYWTAAMASRCLALRKRKAGSGVRLNGSPDSLKCSKYIVDVLRSDPAGRRTYRDGRSGERPRCSSGCCRGGPARLRDRCSATGHRRAQRWDQEREPPTFGRCPAPNPPSLFSVPCRSSNACAGVFVSKYQPIPCVSSPIRAALQSVNGFWHHCKLLGFSDVRRDENTHWGEGFPHPPHRIPIKEPTREGLGTLPNQQTRCDCVWGPTRRDGVRRWGQRGSMLRG